MKIAIKRLSMAFASAGLLTLYGCGGGSSSSSGPSAVIIQGTAATGAPFTDAVVTVRDSTAAVVGTSSPVGADGGFRVTLTGTAKPPYVLAASRTTADGDVQTLVSVAESASATTANVTPITHLIAARLSPSGDPLKLSSELAAGTAKVTPTSVAATVAEVKQVLATLLTASDTTAADPLRSAFSTSGAGYDRLLDSLKISITPANASTTNIEIAVKQKLPDGAQPTVIQFVSSSASVASLPFIDRANLIAPGTSLLIADLLRNLSACHALPLADRVNANGTAAADITSAACKSVFFGNSPSNFTSNGDSVGRDKLFSGIYTGAGSGMVFSQGSYEYTRGNGDVVMGYKSKDAGGNEIFDTIAVRNDSDGKLKLIGNQYKYPGGVSAYHQFRQFITLNQSAYNYYSTGYNLNFADVKGGTGVGSSIFDRVVVTVPGGSTVTLKPSAVAGTLNLNLVKPAGVTGTSYLRLRSVFANPATTADIAAMDYNLFFSDVPRTDQDIASITAQSAWTFSYYLAGNTAPNGVADSTQHYKMRTRALTIEELKRQGLAQLSPTLIAAIQAKPNSFLGQAALPTDGPLTGLDYSVPLGALPVTRLKLFGHLDPASDGPRFDNTVEVAPLARTGTISCTPIASTDLHCALAGAFAASTFADGLHLYARDVSGREFANFYAMYDLRQPQ